MHPPDLPAAAEQPEPVPLRLAPAREQPALAARLWAAVRPVVGVFLWSRATVWLIALFTLLAFEPNRSLSPIAQASMAPFLTNDLGWMTDVWAHWDSVWFLQIAHSGYGLSGQASAFYPLYPGLVAALGRVFGGHYVAAGIVVSLTATLASFALLYTLGKRLLGEDGAWRAVLYLAVFPMAMFLGAVYAESLLLALMLGAFLCAERGHWLWAWILTGLALLTRLAGAALIPALVLLAWRSPSRRRALAGLPLVAVEFAVFPILLWRQTGDALGFVHAEKIWSRQLATLGPLSGAWEGVKAGVTGLARILTHHPVQRRAFASGSDYTLLTSAFNVQALLFLAVFVFLTVVAWRRFGAVYGLFAAASLLIPLSSPNRGGWPLLSLPRFGVTIFPLFLALAALGQRPKVHSAIVAVSAAGLGLVTVQWALWQWMG